MLDTTQLIDLLAETDALWDRYATGKQPSRCRDRRASRKVPTGRASNPGRRSRGRKQLGAGS